MPILKYTTEVDAVKTVGEIQSLLAKAGANAIMLEFADRIPCGVTFRIATAHGPVAFKLPCEIDRVFKILVAQRVPMSFRTKEQAARVGWRIVKHWVEAQLAYIETGQVSLDQAFLAYACTPTGETVYQRYVNAGMAGLLIERQ